MKAAVLIRHGKAPHTVRVNEARDPDVGPKDVLVRVRAAGVNPLDTMIARKEVALLVGYRTPLIMGNELAGEVEAVGAEVTRVRVGQRVMCRMPLDENALAVVPGVYSFEEAAAVSLTAGSAALDLLTGAGVDRAAARRGQRYRFVFVHADGGRLGRAATIHAGQNVPARVGPTPPLAQVSEALARVDAGGAAGKIVLVP